MNMLRPFHSLAQTALLAVVLLLLPSCIYVPGQFESELTIFDDEHFEFSYRGQIRFAAAGAGFGEGRSSEGPWSDEMAYCYDEAGQIKSVTDSQGRPDSSCTAEAAAERKADWERRSLQQRDEEAMVIGLVGFNPFDEAENHKIAAKLMQHEGWKSVVYRGKGVFDVDFRTGGQLDRDFMFPMIPGVRLTYPFVTVRKLPNGPIEVEAGGLAGTGLAALGREAGLELPGKETAHDIEGGSLGWSKGKFAIHAKSHKLSGNGRSDAMHRMDWDIDLKADKIPAARLDR